MYRESEETTRERMGAERMGAERLGGKDVLVETRPFRVVKAHRGLKARDRVWRARARTHQGYGDTIVNTNVTF